MPGLQAILNDVNMFTRLKEDFKLTATKVPYANF
jgi:hypothetical protein